MNFTICKQKIINLLKWSERFTKTDMTYITKGGFWWVTGKVGLFLISLVTMVAFARWLDPINYGTYQFVLAGLTLLAIFTLPGINTALIKSIAQKKEGTLQLAIKERASWGTIGTIFSLGLAAWYFMQGNNILAVAFFLGGLLIPFRTTFTVFAAFWNGKKRFDMRAKYEVISAGLSAALVIPAIYLTDNILIIIAIFLASHTFFDWVFYHKTVKQLINHEKDYQAISFGKHLTLTTTLETIAGHLDKIIIWNFLGAVPVAIYSFAILPIQRIQEVLPITYLALPKLGENTIDEQRKKGIISKFLRMFLVSVPTATVSILIGPFLYKFIFPQYLESIVYFQALSLLIALSPFLLLGASLVAEIKKEALYIISTSVPLLKIILFLTLIPYFGLWAIVAAILVAELLRGILTLYFFLKI